MSAEQRKVAVVAQSRLAIAIPAFGRATAIANSIRNMAEQARTDDLDINFYVSDDTPDTSVLEALEPLIAAGIPIFYRHNTPPLHHDRNLIATLLWPVADYVWLLGSAHTVKPGQLVEVYRFLAGQDFIFVNYHCADHAIIPFLQDDEARSCLRERLWHQTLTGVTIYSQTVRDWVLQQSDALRIMTNFPQISVMLGYASTRDFTIGWFGVPSLHSAGSESSSYWQTKAVEVFVDHWSAAVSAFPIAIPPDQRARVIREHSARTDLFNTESLIRHRQTGHFGWRTMKKRHFREAMHLPLWKLLILVVLPVPILLKSTLALSNIKKFFVRAASHRAEL